MTTTVVTSVASRSRIDRARAWLETRGCRGGAHSRGKPQRRKRAGAKPGQKERRGVRLASAYPGATRSQHRIAGTDRTRAGLDQPDRSRGDCRTPSSSSQDRATARAVQPIAHTPGFPRAITAVLTELRLAQFSSEDLATATPDVALLLAAYEAELAELALADWPKILTLAAEGVLTHRLSGLPLLMLDVPIASEAELAFLRALAMRAPEILATVPAADKLTLARVRDNLHWQSRISTFGLPPCPTTLCGRLQRNLFEEGSAPAAAIRPQVSRSFPRRARAGNASRSPGVHWRSGKRREKFRRPSAGAYG